MEDREVFRLSMGRKNLILYELLSTRPSRLAKIRFSNDIVRFAKGFSDVVRKRYIFLDEDAGKRLLICMRVYPFLRSRGTRAKLFRVLQDLEPDHVNYWFYWMKLSVSWRRASSAFIRLFGLRKRDL